MTDGKFRLAKDRCTPTGHETGVFWLAGKPVIAPMVGWELTTAGTSVSCRPFHRGLQDGHGISARQQCFSSRSHLGIVAPRSRQKRVGYICRYGILWSSLGFFYLLLLNGLPRCQTTN